MSSLQLFMPKCWMWKTKLWHVLQVFPSDFCLLFATFAGWLKGLPFPPSSDCSKSEILSFSHITVILSLFPLPDLQYHLPFADRSLRQQSITLVSSLLCETGSYNEAMALYKSSYFLHLPTVYSLCSAGKKPQSRLVGFCSGSVTELVYKTGWNALQKAFSWWECRNFIPSCCCFLSCCSAWLLFIIWLLHDAEEGNKQNAVLSRVAATGRRSASR